MSENNWFRSLSYYCGSLHSRKDVHNQELFVSLYTTHKKHQEMYNKPLAF